MWSLFVGRKQKEKTFIKSIRVNQDIKDFLDSIENYNKYIIELIESQKDFKIYLRTKKENDNTPTLFD